MTATQTPKPATRLKEIRAQVAVAMTQGGVTLHGLARMSGYSAGTIEQYLRPSWKLRPGAALRFAAAMEGALAKKEPPK